MNFITQMAYDKEYVANDDYKVYSVTYTCIKSGVLLYAKDVYRRRS